MSHDGHSIGFEAEVVRFDGPGGWFVVFLPEEAAAEARFFGRANALGAIAVELRIGTTTVRTCLFPDNKRRSYLLPLKAALRKREDLAEGSRIAGLITLCT
jgi:hypothetical protein